MAQQQQWHSGIGEQAWLASLVESFETISRTPMIAADPACAAALKYQLARSKVLMMASRFVLN